MLLLAEWQKLSGSAFSSWKKWWITTKCKSVASTYFWDNLILAAHICKNTKTLQLNIFNMKKIAEKVRESRQKVNWLSAVISWAISFLLMLRLVKWQNFVAQHFPAEKIAEKVRESRQKVNWLPAVISGAISCWCSYLQNDKNFPVQYFQSEKKLRKSAWISTKGELVASSYYWSNLIVADAQACKMK